MKKIIKFADKISNIAGAFTGVIICIACIIIISEILLRSLFNSTMYVAEEYVGYLMAVLSFTGLSYCLMQKGHIRMNFIQRIVSERGKLVADMICYMIGIVFTAYLTVVTYNEFMESLVCGTRSMQVSETPLAIPQFFMPLGGVLLLLQFVAEFLKCLLVYKGDAEIELQEEAADLGR